MRSAIEEQLNLIAKGKASLANKIPVIVDFQVYKLILLLFSEVYNIRVIFFFRLNQIY